MDKFTTYLIEKLDSINHEFDINTDSISFTDILTPEFLLKQFDDCSSVCPSNVTFLQKKANKTICLNDL